ncbi:RidA family protein [uncultured Pseudokineococcus sp.]|uniref:RidA family protein n=1 Tax=uncultured Pseudokineococcus sp. TaxID=1642928 RepID=UPI00262991D1|nr:RidA family protein [uncultured Pseudokineococcus sp.]
MGALERLAELGLELPDVVPPLAAYQPAVRAGDVIWTSGQLPIRGGSLVTTGKVGEGAADESGPSLVPPGEAADLARLCALNALAAVASQLADGETLDDVRVVKVVGFVASDPAFTGQPAVVNGASTLLGEVLGAAGTHARSAVGVAVLPLDAPVEVELQALVTRPTR